jgi:hypothetical protein
MCVLSNALNGKKSFLFYVEVEGLFSCVFEKYIAKSVKGIQNSQLKRKSDDGKIKKEKRFSIKHQMNPKLFLSSFQTVFASRQN